MWNFSKEKNSRHEKERIARFHSLSKHPVPLTNNLKSRGKKKEKNTKFMGKKKNVRFLRKTLRPTYIGSWFTTHLWDLQPTFVGVIILKPLLLLVG